MVILLCVSGYLRKKNTYFTKFHKMDTQKNSRKQKKLRTVFCVSAYPCIGLTKTQPYSVHTLHHSLLRKFDGVTATMVLERLWHIPSHVALVRPNQMHRRHPHTMVGDACAWFGRSPWGW